jgi:anti-sigma regulatory factor (Ser/Thr protein kinase)
MGTVAHRHADGGLFVHEALPYRDRNLLVAGVLPAVRDALAAGRPVLLALPGPNLKVLRDALGADADRVEYVDMTGAGRNPGRIIPWLFAAFIDRHAGRVPQVVGEPVWPGRRDEEYPACVVHEALINLAFAGTAATILCPYDATGLPRRALLDAAATHPYLVEAGVRRPSPGYRDPVEAAERYNLPLPVQPDASVLRFPLVDPPADLLAEVRRRAADRAGSAGLGEDRLADLEVVVSELVTNALRYGSGHGELRIWRAGDEVVCEVRSGGRIDDPLAGRVPPAEDCDHGRGLLLVNYLSDLVRTATGGDGTVVRSYLRV